MHRRDFLTVLAAFPLCTAASAVQAERLHWHDAVGLRHDPAGGGAAPIELSGRISRHLDLVSTRWLPGHDLTLRNDGLSLHLEVAEGSVSFVQGREFELLGVHFHRASLHRVGGSPFPLEIHFLHQAAEGDVMVLGVLVEAGDAHPLLTPLLQAAPHQPGERRIAGPLDLQSLLPAGGGFYSYAGPAAASSDAEPGTWVLYDRPLSASADQIAAFAEFFSDSVYS